MALTTDHGTVRGSEEGSISEREAEVLGLIAEGRSSKEVADVLCVSKRTVDFHLANVYEKLGASNRVQAILIAGRRGLLPVAVPRSGARDRRDDLKRGLVPRRTDLRRVSQDSPLGFRR